MGNILLEDVFCDSGVPQYTFVEPSEYTKTKVALRTKGRGVIVEGPSGIGKTTCIKKILEELDIQATCLSARKQSDLEYINLILEGTSNLGTIIVDDFHLLPDNIKQLFSDLLKVLADESREDVKLVLIGINRAGECLIRLAPDLNNRIDTIKFETNPTEKIVEVITKGEKALNITISNKDKIANYSYGSFHIVQMLCKTICIQANVTEQLTNHNHIEPIIEDIVKIKMQELDRVFETVTKNFAVGNRNRRDGNSPYLKLLMWLSLSNSGALRMDEIYLSYPQYKVSIQQVADKGYITQLINKHIDIAKVLYYEPISKILAIEDPKYVFYLKNIDWMLFAKNLGFKQEINKKKYDFALSFSGEKRQYAEKLFEQLTENEYTVFYDRDNTADILGKDLNTYFANIYKAEAQFVIAMIDSYYPKKVWTVFESHQYKQRFGEDSVIPILFDDFIPSPMDTLYNKGYESINTSEDKDTQINTIVQHIITKMNNDC